MTSETLVERTTRAVGNLGRMRLVAEHWREDFGSPDEVQYDLVELADGSREVRIRPNE